MLKRDLIASLFSGLAVLPLSSMALLAQAPPAEKAELSSLADIRSSIIRAIGAQDQTVEVGTTVTIFTVSCVNSNMNASTHAGRDNEATAIASIVSKAISEKPELSKLIVIRVQYVARAAPGGMEVIDAVEFRKNPSGVFEFHRT
jgi:hypothetical protein